MNNKKKDTYYDHCRRVRKVLIYIENNLSEELSLQELAKLGSFSPYHFHRIFHAMVGESPGSYIRRLRMEKAANRLRYSDESVTDVALEAAYDTPSAFTKGFKKTMGVSPLLYRKNAPSKQTKIQEYINMKPDFMELPDIPVLYVRKTGDYESSAPEAYKEIVGYAETHGLMTPEARIFCISYDDPEVTAKKNLRFDACISAPSDAVQEGEVTRMTIKGGKFAVFHHHDSVKELEKTFDRIFSEWFPSCGMKLADRPCLVELPNPSVKKEKALMEATIYIPLAS